MEQLIDLSFQRFVEILIMISQRIHRDPGKEIQIFLSLLIIQIYAFPSVKYDSVTIISVQKILLRLCDIFLHLIYLLF